MEGNETAGETASEGAPEYVPLEEASRADLEAEFNRLRSEGLEDESAEYDEPESSNSPGEPAPSKDAKQENLSEQDKDAEIAKLRAEREEILRKRVEERKQRETYIQRLKWQLGEERKQRSANAEQLKRKYQESAELNPAEAIEARIALEKEVNALEALDAEEDQIDSVSQNQAVFETHAPEDVTMEDMVGVLQRQGLPAKMIQNFVENPFGTMRGETLVHIAKQAKAERSLVSLAGLYRSVTAENEALKRENEALKKKPNDVLRRVSQTAKQIPQMTAARGGSSTAELTDIDDGTLSTLSRDELGKLYKQLRAQQD